MLQKSADVRKKLPPLKPILALPTWGQKCFESEAKSFEIPDFDLGHPVGYFSFTKVNCFQKNHNGELVLKSF